MIRKFFFAACFALFSCLCSAQTSSIGLHMGSDTAIQQYIDFSNWLGKPVMYRVTFDNGPTWTDIANPGFLSATKQWLASNPNRHEVITVPLIPVPLNANLLSAVAAGTYDSYFKQLAANIASKTGAPQRVIIRLGWESNGKWYPWSAVGRPALYRYAYRHVVHVMRSQCNVLRFEWNVAWASSYPFDYTSAYPGDDVVDVIGMDVYDQYNTYGFWNVLNIYEGLTFLRNFAHQHGKSEAYSEWGLSTQPLPVGNGDDTYYVQGMYNWIKAGGSNVLYADYWNTPAGGPNGVIYSDSSTYAVTVPKSAALYKKLFSQ
jgi:hypothetical protein